jgi:hypothetical protein
MASLAKKEFDMKFYDVEMNLIEAISSLADKFTFY